jgi:8-oxo-dGTP diphosphatase
MGERRTAEQYPQHPDPRMAASSRSASAAGDAPGGDGADRGEPSGRMDRKKLREAKKQRGWTGPGRGAAKQPAGHRAGPAKSAHPGTVLAAGAVLWLPGELRKDGSGPRRPRIALIHRPKYDDWSLPKGKLCAGEAPWEAALREVEEETGLVCRLVVPLPTQHYLAQGRPKEVRYWGAVPLRGEFRPNREVDRMKWLKPEKARAKLTHDRDRTLIDALLSYLGDEAYRGR